MKKTTDSLQKDPMEVLKKAVKNINLVVVKNSNQRKNVYVKKNDFRELLNTFINQFDNALFKYMNPF